jgi:hypothetical protein
MRKYYINPLNSELNPICHLLALGAHHILHVGSIRVKWFKNTANFPLELNTTNF